ncbi:protein ELYS, partial [Hypomesus transpacificus]|uniref:protein ELYS n=1 Tax=Hypomesus transpacificus TaxID=137520 RepID=UPI001F0865C5
MGDLAAQTTSGLKPFPRVTVEVLGEDEIILDSVLRGKFTVGRSGLAWLACGPHLEVVHAVTGERRSAYCFSGGGEHPPTVLAARDFSWLKRSGLLVGLAATEGSLLCLYDLGIARVVKAVVVPGRITAIEPLVSYGGAGAGTQHLHQSLRWFFGVAAVVTDLGHILLVDLCLDDLSCSQSELEASDLEVVTLSPSEVPRLREMEARQGRHLCVQLSSSGPGVSALQYLPRTNQLAVGSTDGTLQLWNMKTLKREYHSQLEGGRVPVHAFTFQEPENDPRNCCYLWAVQSSQEDEGDVLSLHLLQLAFSDRKCLSSGRILYEGLEYCEERYSQALAEAAWPGRGSSYRLLSCQTIEKIRHSNPDRDDSVNEVASPDTSVSVFSWQVKPFGQGNPSTYICVFDINRWYHAQMPDSLRAGESLRSCAYQAVWCVEGVGEAWWSCPLLDVQVHERSLSRGLPPSCPAPDALFCPTAYNFEASCLLSVGLVHLSCSGYQKETLSFLKKVSLVSSEVISSCYSRCLLSGLVSSRLAHLQPSSLSQEEQLDAVLSTAVETSSLSLITGCIRQWTTEDAPGCVVSLRYILEWTWNKVVHTKMDLDTSCAPLFDSSSNFTDPQILQHLQHSQRLLGNLSIILRCLLKEAQTLTQTGQQGLLNKSMVSALLSQYAKVLLWFCRTGLLPEGSDEDSVPISRPLYRYSAIRGYYTLRREELQSLHRGKGSDGLMIDGLVGQCGERVADLWRRDKGGTGLYPPPTLHALLDVYLLEDVEETAKHALVIYLLLDVMYTFPSKSAACVESFPTAFSLPVRLVKLVQGLWLLDHHDYQNSLELLLHPSSLPAPWAWHHSWVLQALLSQGQALLALRYLQATRPLLAAPQHAPLCIAVLLHNRCVVEALGLVRQQGERVEELLAAVFLGCQDLGLMTLLLRLPLHLREQECLESFLQSGGGLQNRELLLVHYLQQSNYTAALQLNHSLRTNMVSERDSRVKERSSTRNSILDMYGKVLPRTQRRLALERSRPYQHPSTLLTHVSRPQPLSSVPRRLASEKVLTRAGFISDVLTKIGEVWVGKEPLPPSSPLRSPTTTGLKSPSPLLPPDRPDPFLGTPITMAARRKSRLLDVVVPPFSPAPLLTPPRRTWGPPRSATKAPELSLLQTPQVVKRARALAASGPVFSSFTPQSILRSSLRPTPVGSPSASPARSLTPPPRPKESRITFIEEAQLSHPEKGDAFWRNGMATERELERLESESGSSIQEVAVEMALSGLLRTPLPGRLSLGLDMSLASVQSADLEFHDALPPEDLEGEGPLQDDIQEVIQGSQRDTEAQEVLSLQEKGPAAAKQQSALPSLEQEQADGQEVESEEQEVTAERLPEEVKMAVRGEQEDQVVEKEEEPIAQQEVEHPPDLEVVEGPKGHQEVCEVVSGEEPGEETTEQEEENIEEEEDQKEEVVVLEEKVVVEDQKEEKVEEEEEEDMQKE